MSTFDSHNTTSSQKDTKGASQASPGKESGSAAGKGPMAQKIYRSASGSGSASDNASGNASGAMGAVAGSSGTGLPSNMRASLENALGTDLSPVRLHTGSESAGAASSLGASAFTVGQDIHFGAGNFNPGSDAGQHLIAHEVAHTVQQRGTSSPTAQTSLEVSQPGDRHETEAERFADSFMSGQGGQGDKTSAVSPVSAGVVSRSVIQRDAAPGAQPQAEQESGGWGDMIIGWIVNRISDAASLLSALASVSVSVARKVIDVVARNTPDILVSVLLSNPAYALASYIIRKLPVDRIRSLLESIDLQKIGMLMSVIAEAGLLVVAGPILFALDPERARRIIQNLDRTIIEPLFRVCNAQAKAFVKSILDQYWPVGIGVEVGGGIGATFGYPIYLGADALFNLSRSTQEAFKFHRRGEVRAAADTGVGAGVFIGTGGRSRGGGTSSEGTQQRGGGIGIGATAGAQAQAGVKMIVTQDFEFPVFEDAAFLSLLIAVTGNDTSTTFTIGSMLFDSVAAMNPMLYNTMTKFEAKAYAEANAAAEAGVRTGNEQTIDGTATWDRQQGAANTGAATWWSRMLNLCASISGRAAVEGGFGVEMRQQFGPDRTQGPQKIELDLSVETTAALQIVHSIPILSQHLPQLPQLDGGVGAKVSFEITGQGESEPQWRHTNTALYAKTGEMDMYQGDASETAISVRSLSPDAFADIDAFLANIDGGVEFKRRFSVGSTLGRKYMLMAGRQQMFNTMLPAQYRAFGFTLEGYLDLETHLTVAQVRSIFRTIYETARTALGGENPIQRLYTEVLTFFTTGQAPAYITSAATQVANTMLSGVKKLALHGQAGLRVAAGGQVGAGAKVRLHGNASGMITMDYDILQALGGGSITVDDLEQLLRSAIDTASGSIEIDGTDSTATSRAAPGQTPGRGSESAALLGQPMG